MTYKTTYTKAEMDELINWFTTHQFEKELDLGSGMYISDIDVTVPPLIHVAKTKYDNRVFSGQINLLYKIKDTLIAQNKVIGEK